ncbi:alpha/beta hydrolase [Lacinutrix chionoecetis]
MHKVFYIFLLFAIFCSCAKQLHSNDPIPTHDNFTITSTNVKEDRVINVWMPPQYENTNILLPVLYMPDGGIKEDFPHIANTLAKLIADKHIPPMLLVGIENTERGRDLTGFSNVQADAEYCPITDGAKNFRAFITNELIPEINNKYRTTDKKGIIGESLAGLFVMETFFTEPETFDFYIAMDPSLWWNDHYLEKEAPNLLQNFTDKEIKLWFAGSNTEDIAIHTKSLAKTFESVAPENLTWKYSNEPNEKHHTIFRATKEKALIWTLD